MAFSNSDKKTHGDNARQSLQDILIFCKSCNYIKQFIENYRIGKPDYKNQSQFLAPFMVEFSNGEKWILYTTTSMRTDRIKSHQWDVMNIKSIDKAITRAFLIYPDSLEDKEKNEFIRQSEKYKDKIEFTVIDNILSQMEIFNLIEEHSLKDNTTGKKKDTQGKNFEKRVAATLNVQSNLIKWKNNNPIIVGLYYDMFLDIVNCFHLNPENVETISATSDKSVIGLLPSGGNPKTDVVVKVTYRNATYEIFTISCKRTSQKAVSIHQYKASSFVNVLDSENAELERLLNAFQCAGSAEALGEEKSNELTNALQPYKEKLALWTLGGIGGEGNPDIQWANYLLVYNNMTDSWSVSNIFDYYNHLLNANIKGAFGTVFGWTYPSKQRGKYIQLKCRII